MARIQLKISVSGVYALETENYRDAWAEERQDSDDYEEGNDPPEMPIAWALEKFQEDLENGDIGLDEVLESGDIDVKQV